ncbi:hypothetical protein [Flavicella marina]|uniref:hypothetical protein n=1 Tax=Flavicella marina TaxID=1475951 RepID=UPI001264541F|nr:hypothetical protein [Flavicella marina]
MTTKICTLIIILISIIGCSESIEKSKTKNDLLKNNLIGKIKSIKTELFEYSLKNDSLIIGEKINSYSFDRNEILEFNKLGFLTSNIEFYSNNAVSYERKYSYDYKNRLQEISEVDHYGKKSKIFNRYYYNENDSLTKVEYQKDDFERIILLERNKNNQCIKRTDYVKDTIQMTFTFQYDNNENIIMENSYLKNDIISKLIFRRYENNLVQFEEITQFNKYDTIKERNFFEYDKENRISKAKSNYINENDYTLTINSYHSNSKLKEQTWKPIGANKYYISTQKWNKNGNLIEYSREDNETGEKNIWNYKYKYDKVGNWISKESFKENKPLNILKRKITYFEL